MSLERHYLTARIKLFCAEFILFALNVTLNFTAGFMSHDHQNSSKFQLSPEESFLRLCGGSSMMRLRSPRSFKSSGFSHTDRCIVGLKKKTLSSPVHTTHLDREEQMSRTATIWQCFVFCSQMAVKSQRRPEWQKSCPERQKGPRRDCGSHGGTGDDWERFV